MNFEEVVWVYLDVIDLGLGMLVLVYWGIFWLVFYLWGELVEWLFVVVEFEYVMVVVLLFG